MARTKEGCERSKILKDIRECFGLLDNDNSVTNSLINDLYWQILKLRECRDLIDKSSISIEFKQGKQDMTIQNPVLKTYNDLIKNQSQTLKSLQMLTDKNSKKDDDDIKELMGFLNKGKKQVRSGS